MKSRFSVNGKEQKTDSWVLAKKGKIFSFENRKSVNADIFLIGQIAIYFMEHIFYDLYTEQNILLILR